jgi:hypothetical protein
MRNVWRNAAFVVTAVSIVHVGCGRDITSVEGPRSNERQDNVLSAAGRAFTGEAAVAELWKDLNTLSTRTDRNSIAAREKVAGMLNNLLRSGGLPSCDVTDPECNPDDTEAYVIAWQNAYFIGMDYKAAHHASKPASYHEITAYVARTGGGSWQFDKISCGWWSGAKTSDCLGTWTVNAGCSTGIGPLTGSSQHTAWWGGSILAPGNYRDSRTSTGSKECPPPVA